MTIIAWDGKTLAADKAGTNCGYRRTCTKIFRVPGGLVGFAGDGSRAMALLEWFRGCRDPRLYPEFQRNEGTAVGCMFIADGGNCYGYYLSPYPEWNQDRFDAIGSGRDYALAAMYLGYDARRAVEVASALDNGCGNGIDVLTLETA